MILVRVFAVLFFASGAAHGQTLDRCKSISSAVERLTCFDQLTVPSPPDKSQAAVQPEVEKAKLSMIGRLNDPESARFQNVVISPNVKGIVCGEVNAKNSRGGYVGFRSFVYVVPEDYPMIVALNTGDPEGASRGLGIWKKSCPMQLIMQ